MIDTSLVINLIIANTASSSTPLTSTNVLRAKEIEQNMQVSTQLPIVYVGFATIESRHPNMPEVHNVFNTYGEELVQSIDIVTMCPETSLVALWTNVYAALVGNNPTPQERIRTGFTYSQGGKVSLTNGKIVWLDRWKIGFPTLFTNFPTQP